MKRSALALGLFILPLLAGAATVDLGSRGVLSLDIPSGWKLASHREEDSGYALTLSPPGDANARCIISVAFMVPGEPVTRDKLQEQVLNIGDQFVDASVEKKKVLQELNPRGSYGYYCVFTDASMVGKPSAKDEFKVVGVAVVRLTDELIAAVSMAADDEKSPEFQGMVAAIRSAVVEAPAKR